MSYRLINQVRSVSMSLIIIIILAANWIAAEDTAKPEVSPHIAEAIKHVATLTMKPAEEKGAKVLKVSEHPLFTFGDAARANAAGTLWAWDAGGRPVAMLELFRSSGEDKRWIHAMSMTSPQLVHMTHSGGATWKPMASDFAPRNLPGDVSVGTKSVLRLRQMKDQAGRFTAHEFWDPNNSRFELRLLTQPVHRYVDPANKVIDGSVFVFAHGTNPEVLVFLEAVGNDAATAKWQFAFARSGSAEMHVELDAREVWTCDRAVGVVGTPKDSYWLFISQREAE